MQKTDFSIRIGRNLRNLRKMRGVSAKQLADRAGMTEDNIRKMERGEREISVEFMVAASVILKCSTQALLDGLDPRTSPEQAEKEIRMLSEQSHRTMVWVASEWQGDMDALITAFGFYAAVPGRYRKYAMMELLNQKEKAINDGAITEKDIPESVREGVPHLQELLGGLYDE